MRSVGTATFTVALASVVGLCGCASTWPSQGSGSPCQVSVVNSPGSQAPPEAVVWFFHGSQGVVGDGDLRTKPPASQGTLLDRKTGTYTLKMAWYRAAAGTLAITGKRLRGHGQMSAEIPTRGYGRVGGLPTLLHFSKDDCWEVTGTLNNSTVTLMIDVY